MAFVRQLAFENANLTDQFTKFYKQAPDTSGSESSEDKCDFTSTQSTANTQRTLSQTSVVDNNDHQIDGIELNTQMESSRMSIYKPYLKPQMKISQSLIRPLHNVNIPPGFILVEMLQIDAKKRGWNLYVVPAPTFLYISAHKVPEFMQVDLVRKPRRLRF